MSMIEHRGQPQASTLSARHLNEYFERRRVHFDLPIALHGTTFQQSVWNLLQTIPYGETPSYGELADLLGNRLAIRAVGLANGRNPISIIH